MLKEASRCCPCSFSYNVISICPVLFYGGFDSGLWSTDYLRNNQQNSYYVYGLS